MTTSTPPPVAVVTASPAFGSTNVPVLAPITISVAEGVITDLTLTNPDGKKVKGAVSTDGHTWTVGEVLGYGKTYTATGTAKGTDGRSVPIKGAFTTVRPTSTVGAQISVGDGAVVGVATAVMVTFHGVDPADRATIEKHVSVTTDPKVDGAWAWIDHDGGVWGLDFRPKDYWPAGTKVHVDVDVYGLDFGGGRYGAADLTSDFTIGRSQVVYADARTHQMVVRQGCTHMNDSGSCTKTVATYPASFGIGDELNDPQRVTRSGIHIVMAKEPNPYVMHGSPPWNYTATEYWAVRISDNGEFIHENPKTVADQGHDNVSHGCINLGPEQAKAYYTGALLGDPVEIVGTSVKLGPEDGDNFDWTIPWSEWTNLSALN